MKITIVLRTVTLFLCLLQQVRSLEVNIQTHPPNVDTDSVMSLLMIPQIAIPASGMIKVTSQKGIFKPESGFSQLQCAVVDPSDVLVTHCELTANNEVLLTLDSEIKSQWQLYIEVKTFTNPPSTAQGAFIVVTTLDEKGGVIETSQQFQLSNLKPNQIDEVKVQQKSMVLGEQTMLTLEFEVTSALPCVSGCAIELTIPHQLQAISTRNKYLIDQNMLRCSFQNVEQATGWIENACIVSRTDNQETLRLQNPITKNIQAKSVLKIQIDGFRNPLSLQPLQGYLLSTQDAQSGIIQLSKAFSVQAFEPATIKSLELTMENGSRVIGQKTGLRLDMIMPLPLQAGCILQIQIPSDFQIFITQMTNVIAFGMFGNIRSLPFNILDDGIIEIRDACQQQLDNSAIQATLKLRDLTNPKSVRDTGYFTIKVLDQNRGVLAISENLLYIKSSQFEPGSLTQLAIQATNPIVQEKSSVILDILPEHKLSQNAQIKIQFPTEISLNSYCQVQGQNSLLIASGIQCQSNIYDKTVTVQYLFYSFGFDPKLDGPINLTFQDLILINPSSVIPTLQFTVQTLEQNQQNSLKYETVDQKIVKLPEFNSPGKLKNVQILTKDVVNSAINQTLSVQFELAHPTPSYGAAIRLWLPSDFSWNNAESLLFNTTQTGIFSVNKPNIIVNEAVASPLSTIDYTIIEVQDLKALAQNKSISFVLGYFNLPRYQGQVQSPLIIETVNQEGQTMDKATFTYFVQSARTFDTLQFNTSSLVNGQDIHFNLEASWTSDSDKDLNLFLSDQLHLTVPNEMVRNPQHIQCFIDGKQMTDVKVTEQGDETKLIQIALTWEYIVKEPRQITLLVQGLNNPYSTRPVTEIAFAIKDKRGNLLVHSSKDALNYKTQQPSAFEALLVQSNTNPMQYANYQVKLLTSLAPNSVLQVKLPECMQFSPDTSLQNQYGVSLKFTLESPNTLLFTPEDEITQFKISNLANPSDNYQICPSSVFVRLTQVTQANKLKEQFLISSTQLPISLSCKGNCLSCDTFQKYLCTQCNQDAILFQGSCIQQCPVGTFHDAKQNQCRECDLSKCASCETRSDFCLTCSEGLVATQSGQCVSYFDCDTQPGMFVNKQKGTCDKCQSSCRECSSTKDFCTACNQDQFIENNKCVFSCSLDYEVSIQNRNECVPISTSSQFYDSLTDLIMTYSFLTTLLLAMILKVICCKRKSLLMSLVILSADFEAASLIKVLLTAQLLNQELTVQEENTWEVKFGFIFLWACLGLLICLNICMTIFFFNALRKKAQKRQENRQINDEEEAENYRQRQINCTTVLVATSCVFLSHHNTGWLNIEGQMPLSLKRRLYFNNYPVYYTKTTKLEMILPRFFIQVFGICYGIFGLSFTHIDLSSAAANWSVRMALVDLTLLSLIHSFFTLIALNFQWIDSSRDEILSTKRSRNQSHVEDRENGEFDRKGGITVRFNKNSLALHHLRLSNHDINQLKKRSKAVLAEGELTSRDKSKSFLPVKHSFQVQQLFEDERMKQKRKQTVEFNSTKNDILKKNSLFMNNQSIQKESKTPELATKYMQTTKQSALQDKKEPIGEKDLSYQFFSQVQSKVSNRSPDSDKTNKTHMAKADSRLVPILIENSMVENKGKSQLIPHNKDKQFYQLYGTENLTESKRDSENYKSAYSSDRLHLNRAEEQSSIIEKSSYVDHSAIDLLILGDKSVEGQNQSLNPIKNINLSAEMIDLQTNKIANRTNSSFLRVNESLSTIQTSAQKGFSMTKHQSYFSSNSPQNQTRSISYSGSRHEERRAQSVLMASKFANAGKVQTNAKLQGDGRPSGVNSPQKSRNAAMSQPMKKK